VELMGVAYESLHSTDLIDGVIDGLEADRFLVTYLILVIESRGVVADIFEMPPCVAGHELASLYKSWRGRASPPDDSLTRVRDELSRLFLAGDEGQRRRVVDGVLEHIFEDSSSRADFKSWKDAPLLAQAYEEATEWIQGRP